MAQSKPSALSTFKCLQLRKRRQIFAWHDGTPIFFFLAGGMHAYTADFLCVVVSVPHRVALPKGFLWKGFHASRLADFAQKLSQVEFRKDPALTLLFCMFLCGSPQPGGMYSSPTPSEPFMFHYLQMGRGSKLTNREGSFSLISLCSPAWFWNVFSGSDWMSLILEHRNLSSFSPFYSSVLHSPFLSFLLFFASFVFVSVFRPVCPQMAHSSSFP